jgi:hypothetical protein
MHQKPLRQGHRLKTVVFTKGVENKLPLSNLAPCRQYISF